MKKISRHFAAFKAQFNEKIFQVFIRFHENIDEGEY